MIEVCTHLICEVELASGESSQTYIDPTDVKPGQSVRYAIYVVDRGKADEPSWAEFDILEDEEFPTRELCVKRLEELLLKYPGAVHEDY
jgi:hypothetical protein